MSDLDPPALSEATATSPITIAPTTGSVAALSSASATAAASSPPGGATKKKGFSETVKGISNTVSKEFYSTLHQVAQIAGEKLGTAESTELPQEYLDLEVKVDRIKALHENLSKAVAMQVQPGNATDIKFSVYRAINDVVDSFGKDAHLTSMNEKLRTVSVNPQNPNKLIAEELAHAGDAMKDTPLGSALHKAAEAQQKIGEARSEMNAVLNENFIIKLAVGVETNIRQANHYRRVVYNSRIKLDALKSRARGAGNSEKGSELQEELKVGQQEFNSLVTLTTELMRNVVASNEPLIALTDMMMAMLKYFETGHSLLSALVPELQAMKEAQEAQTERVTSDGEL